MPGDVWSVVGFVVVVVWLVVLGGVVVVVVVVVVCIAVFSLPFFLGLSIAPFLCFFVFVFVVVVVVVSGCLFSYLLACLF